MIYKDLREFLAFLEDRQLLKRITHPVSAHLEITEIHRRVLANGGPALLFEHVIKEDGTRSTMPVLVNLFGTVERIALAMNSSVDQLSDIGEMLAFLKQPEPPHTMKESLAMLPLLKKVMAMKPKMVKTAPCQEVVWLEDNINLSQLPIQGCWPNEPAPLITWPLIVTKGAGEGREDNYNLGIYRLQQIDRNRTLMRWLKHRGGAQHHQRWKEKKSTVS